MVKQYGFWTVLDAPPVMYEEKHRHCIKKLLCKCVCGTERYVLRSTLRNGQSVSCGCFKPQRLRPYEAVYNLLLRSTHHEVHLSFEEFLTFAKDNKCHYCGDEVSWVKFTSTGVCPPYNLDRKDNAQGYTKENCVVCCKSCNYGKGDTFTYQEWVVMAEALRRFRCQQLAQSAAM